MWVSWCTDRHHCCRLSSANKQSLRNWGKFKKGCKTEMFILFLPMRLLLLRGRCRSWSNICKSTTWLTCCWMWGSYDKKDGACLTVVHSGTARPTSTLFLNSQTQAQTLFILGFPASWPSSSSSSSSSRSLSLSLPEALLADRGLSCSESDPEAETDTETQQSRQFFFHHVVQLISLQQVNTSLHVKHCMIHSRHWWFIFL